MGTVNKIDWKALVRMMEDLGPVEFKGYFDKERGTTRWTVHIRHAEVKKDGGIAYAYGDAATPEEAILDYWRKITELPEGHYVVLGAMTRDREAFRWAGTRWQRVQE